MENLRCVQQLRTRGEASLTPWFVLGPQPHSTHDSHLQY